MVCLAIPAHQDVAVDLKTKFKLEVAEPESGVSIQTLKTSDQMRFVVVSESIGLGGVEVSTIFDEAAELTRHAHGVVQSVRRGVGGHLESGRCMYCWRVLFWSGGGSVV